MSAPANITVSYGASSAASLPITKPNGTTPMDPTLFAHEIYENGGLWFVSPTGVQTFVPWGAITSIVAQ